MANEGPVQNIASMAKGQDRGNAVTIQVSFSSNEISEHNELSLINLAVMVFLKIFRP